MAQTISPVRFLRSFYMTKRLLIDAIHPEEIRVVIQENDRIEEFDYESSAKRQLKGNIYLAKVTRVEPSLQAAFVDYGGERHGFLPFSEIHPDYYQIPVSDREQLLAECREEAKAYAEEEEQRISRRSSSRRRKKISAPSEEDEELEEEKDLVGEDEEDEEELEEELHERDSASEYESFGDIPHRLIQKRYKIQEVIKRGQLVQVQVVKEERGNKGASLTTYISLAGRYCVFMAKSAGQGGVSRRVQSYEDRKRLKELLSELEIEPGSSLIIRTAGITANKADIKRDCDYLKRLWNDIRENTLSASAPAFIHMEGDIIRRFVRDNYDTTVEEVLVEGKEAFEATRDFMKQIMPSHVGNVKQYRNRVPVFTRYGIEEQLGNLYKSVAPLESGGYVVINPTEALVSIDVNSGKATSERNVEETALKTNLEATKEIARQLRLRDLSGLIVIDFIDMMDYRNRKTVERALKSALHSDRARVQISRISIFGLLEMSRQRLRSSFLEVNTVACSHCNGTGVVRSPGTTAVMLLRAVEHALAGSQQNPVKEVHVHAPTPVILYALNAKREEIHALELRHAVRLFLYPDENPGEDGFRIEKHRNLSEGVSEPRPAVSSVDYIDEGAVFEDEDEQADWRANPSDKGGSVVEFRKRDNNRERGERGDRNERGGRNRDRRRGGRGGRDRNRNRSNRPQRVEPTRDSLLKGLWKRIID
jgi:ribonuclease E